MPFEPDILVTNPDDPRVTLVVEAKTHLPNLERTEADLKQYMVRMQVPIGVLITPERLWLYRDSYTTTAPDSVRRIGEYNITNAWRQPPPNQAGFESLVQHWLESLRKRLAPTLPKDLSDALREYVIPAITSGDVRAAHPR